MYLRLYYFLTSKTHIVLFRFQNKKSEPLLFYAFPRKQSTFKCKCYTVVESAKVTEMDGRSVWKAAKT